MGQLTDQPSLIKLPSKLYSVTLISDPSEFIVATFCYAALDVDRRLPTLLIQRTATFFTRCICK